MSAGCRPRHAASARKNCSTVLDLRTRAILARSSSRVASSSASQSRALAMDPELTLFDEPTSALDPELVGEVLEQCAAWPPLFLPRGSSGSTTSIPDASRTRSPRGYLRRDHAQASRGISGSNPASARALLEHFQEVLCGDDPVEDDPRRCNVDQSPLMFGHGTHILC